MKHSFKLFGTATLSRNRRIDAPRIDLRTKQVRGQKKILIFEKKHLTCHIVVLYKTPNLVLDAFISYLQPPPSNLAARFPSGRQITFMRTPEGSLSNSSTFCTQMHPA
jgi:hypothetical protein